MENCIKSTFHEVYDLKGSTINRSVPEQFRTGSCLVAMKDMDFKQNNRAIVVGKYTKSLLLRQVEEDVEFMKSNNLVDYSFIVAIYFGDNNQDIITELYSHRSITYRSIFQKYRGGIRTNLDPEVYFYVGIIDVLTQWDVAKIGEYGYKTLFLSQDKNQLSAVNPKLYAKRFVYFLCTIIE